MNVLVPCTQLTTCKQNGFKTPPSAPTCWSCYAVSYIPSARFIYDIPYRTVPTCVEQPYQLVVGAPIQLPNSLSQQRACTYYRSTRCNARNPSTSESEHSVRLDRHRVHALSHQPIARRTTFRPFQMRLHFSSRESRPKGVAPCTERAERRRPHPAGNQR